MKQKNMIDMAADRGAFIDQSQSLNIFMEAPSFGKLTSMHFYCWRKGLKTGMCVSSSAHAQLPIRKMHSEPSRRLRRIGCSFSARLDADGSALLAQVLLADEGGSGRDQVHGGRQGGGGGGDGEDDSG